MSAASVLQRGWLVGHFFANNLDHPTEPASCQTVESKSEFMLKT